MNVLACDVETTGVGLSDKVVELAWVHLDENLVEINRDCSLIDPEIPIPSGASAVNGITNKMVADEPTIEQYMHMKQNPLMLEDSVLVAYNAKFDFRYLKSWLADDVRILCTMRLAKKLYPGLDSYKLQALRYSLDLEIPEGDAHRADFDTDVMLALVRKVKEDYGMSLENMIDISMAPLEVTQVGFGKHRGKQLAEVPIDYWQWLFKQDNVDADLKASVLAIHPHL